MAVTSKQWKDTIKKLVDVKEMIEKANSDFKRMSKTNKRITICQDALDQINRGWVQPGHFGYMSVGGDLGCDDEEAQLALLTTDQSCRCCALGTLLISGVRCNNSLDPMDIMHPDDRSIKDYFDDIFDRDNLSLVESAFEQKDHSELYSAYELKFDQNKNEYISHPLIEKAIKFGNRYSNPTKRVQAILRNMIKNQGIFKP